MLKNNTILKFHETIMRTAAGILILIFIAVNIDKYNPYKQKLHHFLKVGRVPEGGKKKFKKHWSTPCVQE